MTLQKIFREILERAPTQKGLIQEEAWRVCDKIAAIRGLLKGQSSVGIERLFSSDHSKGELIVTFLAVLELMKIGDLFVGKEESTDTVKIFSR